MLKFWGPLLNNCYLSERQNLHWVVSICGLYLTSTENGLGACLDFKSYLKIFSYQRFGGAQVFLGNIEVTR